MAMDMQAFKQKCEEVHELLRVCCEEENKSCCAQRLLQIQERLLILRGLGTSTVHEEVLRPLEQDLVEHAKDLGVKLKPPKGHLPSGLQNFDYFHTFRNVPAKDGDEQGHGMGGMGMERNLLIVLHGFGGRKEPFSRLPEKLALPTTAFLLILNAPQALPEELLDDPPGYSWFEMIDEDTGDFIPAEREERRRIDSLEASVKLLWQCVDVLTARCGWQHHEIFLFGYGQGGTVALDMIVRPPSKKNSLAGVVTVAAEVLPERRQKGTQKGLPVPVLLINGALDRCVSPKSAEESAQYLQDMGSNFELKTFEGRGGEMLRGHHEEESRCFMTFLSDNLNGVGRKGSAEATAQAMQKIGALEVGEAPFWLDTGQVSSGHSLNEMD